MRFRGLDFIIAAAGILMLASCAKPDNGITQFRVQNPGHASITCFIENGSRQEERIDTIESFYITERTGLKDGALIGIRCAKNTPSDDHLTMAIWHNGFEVANSETIDYEDCDTGHLHFPHCVSNGNHVYVRLQN